MPSLVRQLPAAEFSAFSDETVVQFAQRGDMRAVEAMVGRYRDFVRARTRMYFLPGSDREDVIQEGLIALHSAIVAFDSGKNSTFKTFAELCISRHMISMLKKSRRQKHIPLNQYVSLDSSDEQDLSFCGADCFADDRRGRDPEQLVIEKEQILGMKSWIGTQLSEFEMKVMTYYLGGASYESIAKRLRRDTKSIDNALQRARKKFEKTVFVKNVCKKK